VKQKYVDRVVFHKNLESLHKYFDKEFLPECLGGDLTEEEAAVDHDPIIADYMEKDVPFEGIALRIVNRS